MGCLLKCGAMSPGSCARCGLAGPESRPICPRCKGVLCFLDVEGDRARWGCDNPTGCGATISVPLTQSVRQAEAVVSAEAELQQYRAERRRRLQAARQRRSRERRGLAMAAVAASR